MAETADAERLSSLLAGSRGLVHCHHHLSAARIVMHPPWTVPLPSAARPGHMCRCGRPDIVMSELLKACTKHVATDSTGFCEAIALLARLR